MSQDEHFSIGQRWISHGEIDLGLGRVCGLESRQVRLEFPAAGEVRTYGRADAPLSRVRYQTGDWIRNEQGLGMRVESVTLKGGCCCYRGQDDAGKVRVFDEADLDSSVSFNRPQDRLLNGQIDADKAFRLRLETLQQRHRHQRSTGFGLLGPRVSLLPHQLYVAAQVAQRHAPRVLLADEVGLGKTIEAGLILHHQLLSGRARRVLVLVPDSLVHQWLVEMLRRFNLAFTLLDHERCQALAAAGEGNPFETAQLVICAQSLLLDDPALGAAARDGRWDLLVVDEAHHLGWESGSVSPAYVLVESLAAQTPGVLLLTATPEQLGRSGHFARLRLLDPDRYPDLGAFKQEQGGYVAIRQLLEVVERHPGIQALRADGALMKRLEQRLGEESLESALRQAQPLEALKQALLDRFGTGRVLYRNTRAAVGGFAPRHLQPHPLEAPPGYRERDALELLIKPERCLGDGWLKKDPRVAWLAAWLQINPGEKVLLICAECTTARELEGYLRLRLGVRSAVFHQAMSLVNRDRAAAYFAQHEGGAQILVCSEIGSEGRNFQFAHHLVLFDLPLDPDLLEQRIGRLDRVGQRHPIQIHVPYYVGSAQERLFHWLHQGLDAFLTACASGQALYARFGERLKATLLPSGLAQLGPLIEETSAHHAQLEARLAEGRDRLLELNSCQPAPARALIDAIASAAREAELAAYAERLFDHFGIEQEDQGNGEWILQPGERMFTQDYPGLPREGCRATTAREQALQREDLAFLTWEHPMIWGAMEALLSEDYGNAALCTLHLPPLKPGGLLLEAVFVLHCAAPRALQIERYLPSSSVRLVLDETGNRLEKLLSVEQLNARVERVPGEMAQQIATQARPRLQSLLEKAERQAVDLEQAQKSAALAQARELQGGELLRLQTLARHNPAIRDDEIARQKEWLQSLESHLGDASLRLDAVRVVLVT
ncbi:RNA polymerase-associated protein RapA [Motiliproteus sp. SC1-56]|uniref:RNA polymerase-associated protein RapA n=1 Tax=Motiliproteus sp. SC1-56 TaxID=2799565 RepID=UPI001A8D33E0